jgi:hypothetical protein
MVEGSLRVRGVYSRIVDGENFECKMYTMEQEATKFESANPTTAAIKLAKYGKEQWSVGFIM